MKKEIIHNNDKNLVTDMKKNINIKVNNGCIFDNII